MKVWEKYVDGKKLGGEPIPFEKVFNSFNGFGIRACELESILGYTGGRLKCKNDCEGHLRAYLAQECKVECKCNHEFNIVHDEMGAEQLTFF